MYTHTYIHVYIYTHTSTFTFTFSCTHIHPTLDNRSFVLFMSVTYCCCVFAVWLCVYLSSYYMLIYGLNHA